jgi:ribosomal protein S18 acetylase RimI-like enzyme
MYIIKKAGEPDIVQVCLIGAQTFTDAYAANNTKDDLEAYIQKSFSQQTIADEIAAPGTAYYLCYEGEQLIGYSKINFGQPCEAFEGRNVSELQRIYVTKEYYHKKAGKELMIHALDRCRAEKFEYLWLGVWKENHRALKFYASWGFETVGERSFKVGSKIYEDYYLRKKL